MVLKRLCNLISRQARAAAASNKTAKIQISSDYEQLEPTLGCSLCFSAIEGEVLVTIVTNKDRTRKRQNPESKKKEIPVNTATRKKGRDKQMQKSGSRSLQKIKFFIKH